MRIKSIICCLIALLPICKTFSQTVIVDKKVAVVGKSLIKYSDIEEQYIQYLLQGYRGGDEIKCEIFEDLLVQKLMVTQAQVDSLEVTPGEVEMQIDRRMDAMVGQAGSQEKLLQHLGKSMLEIKKDLYKDMEEMILMQKMREDIVKDVTITPEEVKKFYKSIPSDSLPRVDSKIEINQIVLYPESSEDAVYEVRKKLLEIREKIIGGANFATQAVLYSEGPTATRGGDRGWTGKSDMDPVYAKAAFALKEGQVSKIVETDKGFNIIQLIEREDERIHTRHILMKPKTTLEEKTAAMEKLDSVIDLVYKDSLTFEAAATRFSMDEKTFLNGGQMVNEYTMETTFDINQFESREYYILRNLSVGQISEPFESVDENGKMVFKVFMLKSRTEPHVANLKDDFDMLKQYAVAEKQEREFKKWISEKLKSTYVVIEEPYNDCDFKIQGWIK